jgi:hypothetical protein
MPYIDRVVMPQYASIIFPDRDATESDFGMMRNYISVGFYMMAVRKFSKVVTEEAEYVQFFRSTLCSFHLFYTKLDVSKILERFQNEEPKDIELSNWAEREMLNELDRVDGLTGVSVILYKESFDRFQEFWSEVWGIEYQELPTRLMQIVREASNV